MNIVLVFFSAILLALSFPRPGWWWLAFVAIVPLIVAFDRAGGLRRRVGVGLCWAPGFVAAMGYWLFTALVSHYGVGIFTAVVFVFLFVCLPMALLYFGLSVAYHYLRCPSPLFYALILPALWIFIDYMKARLPFLVPWGDIGYAMTPFASFVQIADIGGVYGVSFLVLMINGLTAYVVLQIPWQRLHRKTAENASDPRKAWRRGTWKAAVVILLLIALPCAYGVFRLCDIGRHVPPAGTGKRLSAVIVQGNFKLADRWSGMGFANRLKTYLEMSQIDETAGHCLIVWPETVLNASRQLSDELFLALMQSIGERALLVSGGVYAAPGVDKTYNSAFLISGKGRLTRYDKHILLPYAESVPAVDLLGRYYNAPEHFAPGRSPVALQSRFGRIGVSICLEILYPDFVRRSVARGACILVNLSNDGWFGRSAMPHLHLNAARMRAIENRRFLLRAANSGLSALIGPDGHLLAETELFERQRIAGRLMAIKYRTVYNRFGDWVVWAAAGIIGLAVLQAVIRR